MGDYEALYGEYIALMDNVDSVSKAALLAQCAEMAGQALKMDKSLETWEGDMNGAEATYCVDAYAMVMQKMKRLRSDIRARGFKSIPTYTK